MIAFPLPFDDELGGSDWGETLPWQGLFNLYFVKENGYYTNARVFRKVGAP